jgi:transcriptional regulator with XRE-family HTH domain
MKLAIEHHIAPARRAAGIPQADLAAAIGMTAPMLSQIEHGNRPLPEAYFERLPRAVRSEIISAVIAELIAMR